MEQVTRIHALLIDLCTNLVLNLASSFQQQSTMKTFSFPHGFVTGWPVHPKIPKIHHTPSLTKFRYLSIKTEYPLFYADVQSTELEGSRDAETSIDYPKFQAP